MADENQEVTPTSQDTQPVNGSETTTEVESTTTTPETDKQPGDSSENQDGNTDTQAEHTEDHKPSRIERRIDSLVSKLKETSNNNPLPPKTTQVHDPAKPTFMFTPEEVEEGAINPETFEQRVNEKVKAVVAQTLEEERRKQETERVRDTYVSMTNDHIADAEKVKESIDANLEPIVLQQYEALNYQMNPFTGEKVFVPAVKMSEIAAKVKASFETAVAAAAQGNRQFAASVDQNSAVPTGGSSPKNNTQVTGDTTDFAAFEKQYSKK
jgi:hypothetical protein